MRYSIFSCLLIIFISCSTPKPESILLKVQFQPEKTYQFSTIRVSETEITYSGEDFAMRKLESMHVKNPAKSTIRTKTDTELVIGNNLKENKIPIRLVYKKVMSFDGKNEIPEGTVVTGSLNTESQPDFKTVAYSTLSINQRIKLLQSIKNTFEQFRFPEKSLGIGDTLSVIIPTSIAMEASEIKTIVTTNCKLISIENGIATFDLSQTYQMTPIRMDNSFTGNGKGAGKMCYDISNRIISEYTVKSEIAMNKKLDYFEFDLKTTSEFSQSTNLLTK